MLESEEIPHGHPPESCVELMVVFRTLFTPSIGSVSTREAGVQVGLAAQHLVRSASRVKDSRRMKKQSAFF